MYKRQFHTCLEILDDFPAPNKTRVDPESVVYMVANLDSMYYVLLDHHLTAKWPTPSVPPPHKYFPALLNTMGTEVSEATASLMQRGGPVAAASFRKAWGLSESFHLPDDVDPLRVVRSSPSYIPDAGVRATFIYLYTGLRLYRSNFQCANRSLTRPKHSIYRFQAVLIYFCCVRGYRFQAILIRFCCVIADRYREI